MTQPLVPSCHLVVLEGHSVNPGDLEWRELQALARTCTIHDFTVAEEVVERCRDAEAVMINKTVLGEAQFAQLPKLRYIGVFATGYNVVDTAAAARRGITITNIPAYSTDAVAQHTFALLLELTNAVGAHDASIRRGDWQASGNFCYWIAPLTELTGKRLGLLGYGKIGRAVARIARAFGLIVAAAKSPHHQGDIADDGTPLLSPGDLLQSSDILSLHCPMSAENFHWVNRERLAAMKPGAILLNTARGQLVDSQALAEALASGHLAGAALDVLEEEPPPKDNPLLTAPHCILTPHIAWAAKATRKRLLDIAVQNFRSWLQGAPQNTVS